MDERRTKKQKFNNSYNHVLPTKMSDVKIMFQIVLKSYITKSYVSHHKMPIKVNNIRHTHDTSVTTQDNHAYDAINTCNIPSTNLA